MTHFNFSQEKVFKFEPMLIVWKMYLTAICCLQIPPAPPKPDFDVSREKLQKLGEGNKRK